MIQTHASRPFEAVSIDLGYLEGIHYLILADRYSGWPMVKRMTKLNTKSITTNYSVDFHFLYQDVCVVKYTSVFY